MKSQCCILSSLSNTVLMQETLWEAEFAATVKSAPARQAAASSSKFETPVVSSSAKSIKPVPYWVQDTSTEQTFKPLKFGGELEVFAFAFECI
jgi:hypothetical protein